MNVDHLHGQHVKYDPAVDRAKWLEFEIAQLRKELEIANAELLEWRSGTRIHPAHEKIIEAGKRALHRRYRKEITGSFVESPNLPQRREFASTEDCMKAVTMSRK